ncbi:MAG: hypothetical protein ACI8ZO_001084 [Flavobacteriales bacterium]|jgi:hypothetical protein
MKKILGLFIALLTLTNSININLSSHTCGGNVVDISLFGSANNCGMEMMEKPSNKKPCRNNNTIEKTPCCKDQNTFIASQVITSKADFELNTTRCATYLVKPNSIALSKYPNKKDKPTLRRYTYPPLIINYQIVLQVFRI